MLMLMKNPTLRPLRLLPFQSFSPFVASLLQLKNKAVQSLKISLISKQRENAATDKYFCA
jgi:hypothetical protein